MSKSPAQFLFRPLLVLFLSSMQQTWVWQSRQQNILPSSRFLYMDRHQCNDELLQSAWYKYYLLCQKCKNSILPTCRKWQLRHNVWLHQTPVSPWRSSASWWWNIQPAGPAWAPPVCYCNYTNFKRHVSKLPWFDCSKLYAVWRCRCVTQDYHESWCVLEFPLEWWTISPAQQQTRRTHLVEYNFLNKRDYTH